MSKRKDLILLDDTLQIMVTPNLERKWITYDDLDDMRVTLSPDIPRMIYNHNEMEHWFRKMKLDQRAEVGE